MKTSDDGEIGRMKHSDALMRVCLCARGFVTGTTFLPLFSTFFLSLCISHKAFFLVMVRSGAPTSSDFFLDWLEIDLKIGILLLF